MRIDLGDRLRRGRSATRRHRGPRRSRQVYVGKSWLCGDGLSSVPQRNECMQSYSMSLRFCAKSRDQEVLFSESDSGREKAKMASHRGKG
jgi:hypothetical protein